MRQRSLTIGTSPELSVGVDRFDINKLLIRTRLSLFPTPQDLVEKSLRQRILCERGQYTCLNAAQREENLVV